MTPVYEIAITLMSVSLAVGIIAWRWLDTIAVDMVMRDGGYRRVLSGITLEYVWLKDGKWPKSNSRPPPPPARNADREGGKR